MTNVSEAVFLNKLYEVVYKLSGISKTQSYRFNKEWDESLSTLNQKPHLVRQIPVEKGKFLNDINYRIEVLNTVKLSFEDGFHSIKSLLNTIYHSYFEKSDLFKKNYSKEDQLILKYLIAKKILGDLIQYNSLDHETVPIKYNILARNYTMMKFKEIRDTEILDNLKKIKIELTLPKLKKIMQEIVKDGLITKTSKGRYLYYNLSKELELSKEGEEYYKRTIRSLIEWPTLFWRSYYNIRELNVTVNQDCKDPDFLNNVLSKAATQGYIASHYVFKNLVQYYEKIKDN
ncbi:MAG: hypothetical protein ACFE85_04745 [Candidatus Hodarchaeota archaeon]